MLSLDSPRWSKLRHAYGAASDIPKLLEALKEFPAENPAGDPWFTLWSALAHQGDVYPASFAAVPHIVAILANDPRRSTASYFQLPTWIEICRLRNGTPIPVDCTDAYFEALTKLPELCAQAAKGEVDEDKLLCLLSAIAASKQAPELAAAILELNTEVLTEFKQWSESR
jgi:hypothetical protein